MDRNKLVFSGVQPTGNLHLGNYLGALKNFVALQKQTECIYCVVDLHAITVFQDPKELKNNEIGFNEERLINFKQKLTQISSSQAELNLLYRSSVFFK